MARIRLDPHTHLYDCHPLREWVQAALDNLAPGHEDRAAVVIVDRQGQDSFTRLRQEVPLFGEWTEYPNLSDAPGIAVAGAVTYQGEQLLVIRGAQYVTAERLEVLGLGIRRDTDDGAPCGDVIQRIRAAGGVVYLPWSPGKWLGARGQVVAAVMDQYKPGEVVFGDISMRSKLGPPSALLGRARRQGFMVLPGSDPLPRYQDLTLVGSYGGEFAVPEAPEAANLSLAVIGFLRGPSQQVTVCGRPNRPIAAFLRFLSTL